MTESWSFSSGLRRALTRLSIVTCFGVLWAVPLHFSIPGIDWLGARLGGSILAVCGAIIVLSTALWLCAGPVGSILAHRLNEHLGVDGLIPAVLGVTFAWLIAVSGYQLATWSHPTPSWLLKLTCPAMGLQSSVIVIWRTWLDPPA